MTRGELTLTQSDFDASLSVGQSAGAVNELLDIDTALTTLKQSGCTFHFTNLNDGAAGIYVANLGAAGRLILTQTNVCLLYTSDAADE